eukprot:s112_g30.t1
MPRKFGNFQSVTDGATHRHRREGPSAEQPGQPGEQRGERLGLPLDAVRPLQQGVKVKVVSGCAAAAPEIILSGA